MTNCAQSLDRMGAVRRDGASAVAASVLSGVMDGAMDRRRWIVGGGRVG